MEEIGVLKIKNTFKFENFKEKNLKFLKLTDEQLKEKYDKVGTTVCKCQHNIDCKKCYGDGKCNNCINNGISNHKHMCYNWLNLHYINNKYLISIGSKPI